MKLLELHIDGFGKFHDQTFVFHDGINVIYGKNEAGKSTLHTFIRSMLFGIERGRGRAAKNDLYSRFEPWENSGTYEGWLRLESGGTVYRLERKFRKDNKSFRLINETLGKEEEPTKALMDQILGGLNETTYNNTISIGQLKSATEEGMVNELKNYIANLNTTGNISLNITKATSFLRNQKRSLEANLVPDASREFTALLTEIRNVEAEIASPEYENQLAALQKAREQVKGVIETTRTEKDELDDKLQKSRQLLKDHGFSDRRSVENRREEADNLYQSFKRASEECEKKSRKIRMILFFLLFLGGLGAAAFCAFTGFPVIGSLENGYSFSVFPICVLLAAVSVVFLGLAVLCWKKDRGFRRQLEETKERLSRILETYLSDGTISDGSMNTFRSRLDEFASLCDMVSRSEAAVKKYLEDIDSLQAKQSNCSELIEKQQRTQWELEKKLEHLSNCRTRAKALKRTLAENDRIREECAAVDLAREIMTDLSSSIRDSFGLYLNKAASSYIAGITGGAYDSMSIDENLGVFLNTRTRLVPLESVSSGTIDQVYLALRLAAAKLLQNGQEEEYPLIFDDSFTQYDDDRLHTALDWLAKAYGGQLILFTCHRREAQMLRARQIPFHLLEI